MTWVDTVKVACRAVVTSGAESWSYRRLTSNLSTEPHTWGSWAALLALPVPNVSTSDEYDDRTDATRRVERRSIRCPDTQTTLTTGDQVKDTAGTYWSVERRGSGGDAAGSIRYELIREIPLKAQPGRGGP